MFNNKKQQKIDEIDTVIGPGTVFEGDINATGIVRVDGVFKGTLKTKGDVIVGDNGNIQGEVNARNITVAGVVKAEIFSNGKLTIRSTGKVIGDVTVDSIVVEEKSIFNGKCIMRAESEDQLKDNVNG